jgi:hypothetical protein
MLLALTAALLAANAPAALPADRPALVVAVHQETRHPLDVAALNAIDYEVQQLWKRYAYVTVRDEAYTAPLPADDVLNLVITDRTSPAGDGLAWIDFVDGLPSHTIYVSTTEVAHLAEQGRWQERAVADWPPKVQEIFRRRAIARSIAHEVGHYLLRSKAHTATGLMRGNFTVADLMDSRSSLYRLDAASVLVLRQRVRTYLVARDVSNQKHL